MRSRKELSPILHSIMSSKFSKYGVYWQKPNNTKTVYPCIIYGMATINTNHADNTAYRNMRLYTITLIGKESDNDSVVEQILALPYCSFDRRFINDNLYHDVFNLYF